jgi:anaerobic nitric oxide reductase flavorubredoxin
MSEMLPMEIKPDIFWVGAIDWGVRDFHGYVTPRGTTYNNYLIMDKHVTLVDTVKHDFAQATIENIRGLVDPSKIENIVINHIEPDHASSIDLIMELCPKAVLYMTEKGRDGLARVYDLSHWDIRVVKTGDSISTGKKTLTFMETAMLHWPDAMVTYVAEDKLLISQDAFGQHIATSCRFDDEFVTCESMSELEDAVVDYYANILMPFGTLIKRKLDEIAALKLDIDMIAPDHGIIWRRDPGKVLNMYRDMATGKAHLSAVIIYDTMWQSTELMTVPIMRGLMAEGVDCKVIKLRATPTSVATKEFWKARGAIIGSPTLNNIMFPSVMEFLTNLRGLRPKARLMGAFGSHGWSGGAVREAFAEFEKMGLESVKPGVEVKFRASAEDKERCYEYGREFARRLKEYHEKF